MKFKLLFTSSEGDCQCLRKFFFEERKYILGVWGWQIFTEQVVDVCFYLDASCEGPSHWSYGWLLHEWALCSRFSPLSPTWCSMFNMKHVLKYFPELMHFNSLWLRTYFPVTRRVENKALGRQLSVSLTQFVICFFSTGSLLVQRDLSCICAFSPLYWISACLPWSYMRILVIAILYYWDDF